jgi:hypothetical protein
VPWRTQIPALENQDMLVVGLFSRHPPPVTFPPPGEGKRGVAVIGAGWRRPEPGGGG